MFSRTVCIIGAFGGIGIEIVKQFSKEKNIDLILMDITNNESINLINNKNISFFEIDLENFKSIQYAFNEVPETYGKFFCVRSCCIKYCYEVSSFRNKCVGFGSWQRNV